MKYAGTSVNRFDFEGSMIQPIEAAFRAMGGRQTPYFQILREPRSVGDQVDRGVRWLRRLMPKR